MIVGIYGPMGENINISITFLRIEAPHFVAGIILKNNRAIRTAPIVKYMVGWNYDRIRKYCKRKGWTYS